jgi:hypothetical protein
MCRMVSNRNGVSLNNYVDESIEKDDYVSELAEPPNRKGKVAAYCADFTFDFNRIEKEKKANWSQFI